MTGRALAVEHLTYRYPGGEVALDDVTLGVATGTRLAVLGANGSGKSSLLLACNGTLRPRRGRVLVQGEEPGYDRRGLVRWRSTVGLVLTDPDDQLFAADVAQDISFGPLNQGLDEPEARVRVDEAVEALSLGLLLGRPTHALSNGQRKRVAIAGILAMRPAVLLLDEPTTGLDPAGVDELLVTLAGLHAGGTTIVMATHDVDLAYGWADEVAVLDAGRVLAAGSPDDVLGLPGLVQAARLRPPTVRLVTQALRARGVREPTPPPRTVPDLLRWLAAEADTGRDRQRSGRPRPP